ncbi:hypothetical protein B0T21DRAFT_381448 [Apiosordaria backusii]|uniref:Nudix hydrolase domain-containing protein n=1 Tax=Apiosordaria backusii TaxID=314023 RepID=A0AA40K0P9_9PEZI|nr:hypothetical protein B0T21DRAFT_381448 [Apiosordaria backusii]
MASTPVPDTNLILAVLKRGNGFMEGDGIKVWQPRQDFPVWRFTILLKRGNQIHPVDSDTVVKCGIIPQSTVLIFKNDRTLSSFFDFIRTRDLETQPDSHMQLKSKYCTTPQKFNEVMEKIREAAQCLRGSPFGALHFKPRHFDAPIPTSTFGILPGLQVPAALVLVLGVTTHGVALNIWRVRNGDYELLLRKVPGDPNYGGAILAPVFSTNVSAHDASPLAALERIVGPDVSSWLLDDTRNQFVAKGKICFTHVHGPEYGEVQEGVPEFGRRYVFDALMPENRQVHEIGVEEGELVWLTFQQIERELFANRFSPVNGLVVLDFLLRYHILHNRVGWELLDEVVARMRYDSAGAQY